MITGGADLGRLRRINELAILGAVRGGANRLSEVAERTGLARASVGEVTRDLVARGWLTETEPVIRGRGRPASLYQYQADAGLVVGADIGAYNLRVVVADLNGDMLAMTRRQAGPETSANHRLTLLNEAIQEALAEAQRANPREASTPGAGTRGSGRRAHGWSSDDVWGVVAGSTGRIGSDGAVLLSHAIPDWAGVDLIGRLRTWFPGRVVAVDNDSRLAALGEQRRGVAQGAESLVVLQAGRRTGLGLVLNHQVHPGFGGVAGDLSQLPNLKWEAAIEFLIQAAPNCPGTGDDPVTVTLEAARADHPVATAAVHRYTRVLANAAAAVISIIDPEAVVLSGSLADYGDVLLPSLKSELQLLCLRLPRLETSTFAADSAVIGATCAAADLVNRTLLAQTEGPLPPHTRPHVVA